MFSVRNGTLTYVAGAFLSENIEETCRYLERLGVVIKNEDGSYKLFNEVMEQIYKLHMPKEQ